MIANMDNRH